MKNRKMTNFEKWFMYKNGGEKTMTFMFVSFSIIFTLGCILIVNI